MAKLRVLVVDDSVVIRRLVSEMLASDPMLEVVGTAANGKIALARIPQVNPDAVVLDVEMPEFDGLQTLTAIRQQYQSLTVIMFSTLTKRGAGATLDALALGANDYVTKPSSTGGDATQLAAVRRALIATIKLHAPRATGFAAPPAAFSPIPQSSKPAATISRLLQRVEVVAIGVSTGGPNALGELIPSIPAELPVPVLIVQHMPPLFTKLLSERLTAKSRITVVEARPGDVVTAGKAWLAPGDYHMIVKRVGTKVIIETNQEVPENSCRPAVDPLFLSVAETYGSRSLGVIMTGMGKDGLRGCEAIRERGGQILVQDEASSVVWGMPGFVARAGLADKIVALSELAAEIVQRTRKPEASARVHTLSTVRKSL